MNVQLSVSALSPFYLPRYPVILSIENHCSVAQQKKMALYLTEILGDKLDLSSVSSEDSTKLPSPESLKGKILVKVMHRRSVMFLLGCVAQQVPLYPETLHHGHS